MPILVSKRTDTILKSRPLAVEPSRRAASLVLPSPRNFQVLQSRSAPAQLCLFLRPGAIDVK